MLKFLSAFFTSTSIVAEIADFSIWLKRAGSSSWTVTSPGAAARARAGLPVPIFQCRRRMMPTESTTIKLTQRKARGMLPSSTAEKIAMGIVWVRPGMLPASMSVAPNSPSARAKARTVPASTPGAAIGNSTLRKTRPSEAPNVRAASRSLGFTCSKAPSAVRYISGKATTVAAITVAGQEKTMVMPISDSARPMKLCRPKTSNRKKPTTVGGRTSGSVSRPSIQTRKRPSMPNICLAAYSPRKKVAMVAAQVVASEMNSGDMSKDAITVPLL